MRRTTFLTMLCALVACLSATAQRVTFASPEFERGVKLHLGLDSADVVMQPQMDTITAINLSHRGITDIRDVVLLPNVSWLDLAHNEITDISPVVSLESLHHLDLRANRLDNIDMLALAASDSMVVNVAYNYITDFGRMQLPTSCRFTFLGWYNQIDMSKPYLDVYQLFAGFEANKQCVFFRVLSNQPTVTLICGNNTLSAPTDDWQSVVLSKPLTAPTKAYLTDGTRGDSTWVIPQKRFSVKGGEELTIETELPQDYSIFYVNAEKGVATLAGSTVTYQAPPMAAPDTITFSYYQGDKLRGLARYLVNTNPTGDVTGDGTVDIADVNAAINVMLGKESNAKYDGRADVTADGTVDIADVNAVINAMLGK